MQKGFTPNCRSLLIGSFPVKDHEAAAQLVAEYSPDIPVWAQLPAFRIEGMIPQFLPGMPGLREEKGKTIINTRLDSFDQELVEFYEDYLGVVESPAALDGSRFVLTPKVAGGFFALLQKMEETSVIPFAVKGQVTGPVTFGIGITDQDQKAIFYNAQVRDAAVKLLSLKAVWQIRRLSGFKVPVIIFIDEPALSGFGSSEYTGISRNDVTECLEAVISAIHDAGGLAGIHVCGNTDWSLILDSSVDIINFDAYAYFDRFSLYSSHIRNYINSGRTLAWGIVPTLLPEVIEQETEISLIQKLEQHIQELGKLGIPKEKILSQSLITPSCGTGSLSVEQAIKVLQLTKGVSSRFRKQISPDA